MKLYYVVVFTSFISILWWVAYIVDTLHWKTKPNRVTWGIWAAAPLIWSVAMYYSQWLSWNILPVFIAWFVPLLVFISSFINPKSYWKLSKIDYICLVFSILALVLWWITKNSVFAIVFSILADFFAAIPIIIKTYKFPETETVWTFFALLISSLSSFLVIKTWNFEEYWYPLYLVFISIVLIISYYWNNIKKFLIN